MKNARYRLTAILRDGRKLDREGVSHANLTQRARQLANEGASVAVLDTKTGQVVVMFGEVNHAA